MEKHCSYENNGGLFEGTAAIVMGTKLELLLCGENEGNARCLWMYITEELERLDKVFNRFRADSDVTAWNNGIRGVESVSLEEAIVLCDDYKERTGGIFDVGFSGKLDFGGFAKGYALRGIISMLRQAGVGRAFVNFGNSSITTIGTHPLGDFWKVALPNPWTGQVVEEFQLCDRSLSVSGNSPQYVGHIINPLSGAADLSRRFAGVLCNDPLNAEILSTAALASTPEQLEHLKMAFPEAEINIYETPEYPLKNKPSANDALV